MSATTWTEEAPGRLRISLRVPIAGRLFGLPFAAVGAYFAWQAAGAVADALRPGTGITLGAALPGAIVLSVLALLFGLPGLLLVAFRAEVVVDVPGGVVSEVKDFRLFTKAKSTSLAEVVRVRAFREDGEHRDGEEPAESYTTTLWTVLLDRRTGPPLTAEVVKGAAEARELAATLARRIGVPGVDETGSATA